MTRTPSVDFRGLFRPHGRASGGAQRCGGGAVAAEKCLLLFGAPAPASGGPADVGGLAAKLLGPPPECSASVVGAPEAAPRAAAAAACRPYAEWADLGPAQGRLPRAAAPEPARLRLPPDWCADLASGEADAARPPPWGGADGAGGDSARAHTFAVPADLLGEEEEPRLEFPEGWAGSPWHASGPETPQLPDACPVESLARLCEALLLGAGGAPPQEQPRPPARGGAGGALGGGARAEEGSESEVVAQAKECQRAAERRVQLQLDGALEQLREAANKRVAAESSAARAAAAAEQRREAAAAAAAQPASAEGHAGATSAAVPAAQSKAATPLPQPPPKAPQPKAVTQAEAPAAGEQAMAGGGAASPRAAAPAAAAPAAGSQAAETTGAALGERCRDAVKAVDQLEKKIAEFRHDPVQKQFRMEAKKTVNIKVSQISASVKRIAQCISGIQDFSKPVLEGPDEGRRAFLEHVVASRLAEEAEVGVRMQSTGRAAWPVAYVATRVFASFPATERIFWGVMCKACPYLIPDFAGSLPGRQGPCPGQNAGEPFSEFADRMVGYLRLWLAVLALQEDTAAIWWWLSRTLNTPPCALSGALLQCALEMVGAVAQARFGKQFRKLVTYIEHVYIPGLQAVRASGEEMDRLRASQSRLRLWLEGFGASGSAPQPEGRRVDATEEAELNPNI